MAHYHGGTHYKIAYVVIDAAKQVGGYDVCRAVLVSYAVYHLVELEAL